MSDSIPSAHAHTDPSPSSGHPHPHAQPPTNAEDRKAAAALSSLHTTQIATDSRSDSTPKPPSAADQEALGKAMSRLEIAAGQKPTATAAATVEMAHAQAQAHRKGDGEADGEGGKRRGASGAKIAVEDVNLLVNELDLSKVRATELLRRHDGDAVLAIRAFVAAGWG
ncbi:hypothetical protein BO70DRAFT_360863 [Aspergillus heteromorphus CBS 117.55]|uniref:Nascent polypeptide-associated complex subunit alpha-like UBA domain-containing protein n=1 Tax=Aspergillus heteromorphus CBS 117.55 TaxID=1448321 RepID=A0A317WP51_9EURO|nr:uncharacterized protein BO70DRAFT_360863 [Aspergillus heteromorphus CBS 117.55]PWY86050.1 hypothetical protein BO70DRAFT_360863 [Aspergillus heteromorphus CBS 117.55]